MVWTPNITRNDRGMLAPTDAEEYALENWSSYTADTGPGHIGGGRDERQRLAFRNARQSYARQTRGANRGQDQEAGTQAFADYIRDLMEERNTANLQMEQDRTTALADLEQLETQIGTDMQEQISFAESNETAQNQRALQTMQNSMAQLGRPISAGLQLQASRRLAAASSQRLSEHAADLRQEAWSRRFDVARQRDAIFQATRYEGPSDAEILGLAGTLGQSLGFGGGAVFSALADNDEEG